MTTPGSAGVPLRLLQGVDPAHDHLRGVHADDALTVIAYQDFLCPYCRRARPIFQSLRETLGDRLLYVFRHFPNERAHPGAYLAARASEAAALQGRFWEMHDAIFDHSLPIGRPELLEMAGALGLEMDRFVTDLDGTRTSEHVDQDVAAGRANGVSGTPSMYVDGVRYDGAWDYHSMLEGLERPFAARVHRTARVFASLPTSAGLVLLVAAVLALICANTPVGPLYQQVMNADLGITAGGHTLSLTTRGWLSEGLLSFFFLLVGLDLRRELTMGALATRRAALLPILAAAGGVVTPAIVYLTLNRGWTSRGWPIPTATDVAFTLAILAVLGERIPSALRVFVAALAIADDIFSVLTIAIVFPTFFAPIFLLPVAGCLVLLAALNRARVYATWPYAIAGLLLWLSLHGLGVDAALTGFLLAVLLPTRPLPSPGPLLAQTANALAELDHADQEARREGREPKLQEQPLWDWAMSNLSAATDRLLSPAERIERAVAPWSAFVILPLFAFSATGISLAIDLGSADAQRVLAGTVAGLVVGKPLGILLASALAVAAGLAVRPDGVSSRQFVGAACLCGIGDTLALLMADRAFDPTVAAVAKLGVLAASLLAGLIGVAVLRMRASQATPEEG